MSRKSLRDFIRENRAEIDQAISRALHSAPKARFNDRERELWIRNDEGLYMWAKGEGVRL